jgi:hypothetical protein
MGPGAAMAGAHVPKQHRSGLINAGLDAPCPGVVGLAVCRAPNVAPILTNVDGSEGELDNWPCFCKFAETVHV